MLGTNGKTSTTRMTAAILERHGLRTGVYTSPHLVSYSERVRIGEHDLQEGEFAAALARAARAAERVNRTLAEDDHVTQFELLTAAALSEMAEREVRVAVVEAGLGGRYDATSVIDAPVTVLTNVGLEHTRWLGPTLRDIAEEKLAVVRPGGTLVLGSWLAGEALAVAERVAGEREARIVCVEEASGAVSARGEGPVSAAQLRAGARRRGGPSARRRDRARRAGSGRGGRRDRGAGSAAGRGGEPADGARRRAQPRRDRRSWCARFPTFWTAAQLGLVMGVLEDKDAASMLAALLGVCERAWFTAPPSPRALSPAALQSLARQLGFDAVRVRAPAGAGAGAGARLGGGERGSAGRCSRRARSIWSAIFCADWAPPIPWICRLLRKLERYERRRPLCAHDDRRRRADRGVGHPCIFCCGLRFRPPVSLNSAGRCHRSHILESKAAA